MAKPKQTDQILQQLEIELPDKKYFTIGEVAELADLKSHVLRYWEQVFPQLEPSKRRGRRYYQKKELLLVLEIKSLLHEQGFTIPGAKARLAQRQPRKSQVQTETNVPTETNVLESMKAELQEFRKYIESRY
jgi:DNA-binding transcriptional MerR regulator